MQVLWYYKNKEFTENEIGDYVAFVYIITNLLNNKKYIGKKRYFFKKTRQVKGKKIKYLEPSDWQIYWGSNIELQEDVKQYGEHNFKREIIRLCKTHAESSYFEAKEQFATDCILKEEFYNSWLSVRVRKSHLKGLTAEQTQDIIRKFQNGNTPKMF